MAVVVTIETIFIAIIIVLWFIKGRRILQPGNATVFNESKEHNVNKLLSKPLSCSILDRPYHSDFRCYSQNEGIILKIHP